MIGKLLTCVMIAVAMDAAAQTEPGKKSFGKPALIAASDLAGFAELPADRKTLLEGALAVAAESPWLPYTERGSSPSDGGFDCSGAMYHVMRKAALDPPRISGEQLKWLQANGRLHEVPPDVVDADHPSLKLLKPGDLLFWGRRPGGVSHVAMYLGTEKDGRRVMINSTNGRSYRGTQANGYGVYDFRLPKAGAEVSFLGYGTPPGVAE